ncbi:MAG TPA: phage tail tip lysozyme [Candidatus Saccharibacteria bacterium]|jgi:hypothetical protein|nr:phage tail tip lysozyme [Candidatus Saccharibacteria bacterium]
MLFSKKIGIFTKRLFLIFLVIVTVLSQPGGPISAQQFKGATDLERQRAYTNTLYSIFDSGCGTNTSSSSGVNPGKLFAIGDSLLVGMDSLGKLGDNFNTDGWSYSANANEGRSITRSGNGKQNTGSATEVINSSSDVGSASVILVVLGTNQSSDEEIKNFYNLIKQKNANAQVFWLSVYPDSVPHAQQSNAAIAQSGAKIITNNVKPDGGDGIHYTASGYKNLATVLVNNIKAEETPDSQVWNFFARKGVSAPQIAGIIGNLKWESSLNPRRVQGTVNGRGDSSTPTSNGWGLMQWTPGTKITGLLSKAGISGPVDDMNTQLELIWWHLNNVSPTGVNNFYEQFKNIQDVEEATIAFEKKMEGAGKPKIEERIKLAKKALSSFGSSAPSQVSEPTQETSCSSSSNNVDMGSVVSTALSLAWDRKVDNGQKNESDAKPSYQQAKNEINPSGDWSDCGVFVSTVMILSGADPDYPLAGTEQTQKPYLESHTDKYQIMTSWTSADLQPGDIFIRDGHTFIYIGQPDIEAVEASLGSRVPGIRPSGVPSSGADGYIVARLKK